MPKFRWWMGFNNFLFLHLSCRLHDLHVHNDIIQISDHSVCSNISKTLWSGQPKYTVSRAFSINKYRKYIPGIVFINNKNPRITFTFRLLIFILISISSYNFEFIKCSDTNARLHFFKCLPNGKIFWNESLISHYIYITVSRTYRWR